MIHTATAMMVRKNLGDMLNNVHYRHDSVLITKAGKPVAALVDVDLFEKICHSKQEFERLTSHLQQVYKDVDETTAQAEIDEALKYIRGH